MKEIRPEAWSVADDVRLQEVADREPVVAKALRFCRNAGYKEIVPFFDILGYVPRTPVHDNEVSVSRRELVRDNRPYGWSDPSCSGLRR